MTAPVLEQLIDAADQAINNKDFDRLMEFYADDATLVVQAGMYATGKQQIRQAFVAIADYFNHSLHVKQGNIQIIEGGDTALVLARAQLDATMADGSSLELERHATYVFRKDADQRWLCTVDNSYGTELIAEQI